jgi:diadenosine tetraphosphate (Ap4A) HIT family hydrolase
MNFAMPVMDPCYFCELARQGPQGWNFIERDELTMTVLNGRQYEAGQSIVFPVRHAPTLLDLNDAEGAAVMRAARRIGTAITQALAPEALLLYQNNGTLSGQEVPHFHLHVVPRTAGSNWGMGPPHLARLQSGDRVAYREHDIVTDGKLASVSLLATGIRRL